MKYRVLEIKDWKPISYPEKKIGTAEIVHGHYKPGYYFMEGVDGYLFWHNAKKIPITMLYVNDDMVMLDDPLHWIGMQRLAEHSVGKVMVGGLGLGLVVHHLINNPKVTEIDVIEKNTDVIRLIHPLIDRKDKKVTLIEGDIFEEPWREKEYDTIINDIWVKTGDKFEHAGTHQKENVHDFNMANIRVKLNNPQAKVFVWGIRDKEMNPAVTIDIPEDVVREIQEGRK